jgi:GTP cyclohydrolase I
LLFALRGYRQSPAEVLGDALFTEHTLHASTAGRVACEGEDSVLSSSEDSEDLFEVQPVGEGPSGETGLVVVRHIDVFSTSDTDLQPFFGRVHVGYLPAHGRIVGLSKTARIAEVFARRLQSPQQLCDNIAVRPACHVALNSACNSRARHTHQAGLNDVAQPHGVAVLLETWSLAEASASALPHSHHRRRHQPPHVTSAAVVGCFADRGSTWWQEFLCLVQMDDDVIATTAGAVPLLTGAPAPPAVAASPALVDAADGPADDAERALAEAATQMVAIAMGSTQPLAPGRLHPAAVRYARALRCATAGYGAVVDEVVAQAVALAAQSPATVVQPVQQLDGSSVESHDLAVVSMCEHHLLPFYGTAHVAYSLPPGPDGQQGAAAPLPRAALQAIVDVFSRRLQVQERLTRQIAEAVGSATGATGVMVLTEAAHMCMASRGVEKTASSTCSTACTGVFASDAGRRAAFLQRLRHRREGSDLVLGSGVACTGNGACCRCGPGTP